MKESMAYIIMGAASAYAALYLATPDGKKWVDENTTIAVIFGSTLILSGLGLILDFSQWVKVALAFGVVGAPMVARKIIWQP